MKKSLSYLLLFFITFIFSNLSAQNCFDADFESGTIGGYATYYGVIYDNGVLDINTPGNEPSQHRIMNLSDGYDPIAQLYCIKNKNLLVAGNSLGKYTLRLGDPVNGARAAKVVLKFNVTPDVSFFLLKYAVVLNDPMHDYSVQPRFELRITDDKGNILNCGKYEVRASANLPGFENCEDWRVRPWTAVGFELQSYIGKTINIEIISADCGLGGHGGYAYIDAKCDLLAMQLESYCPDKGFARFNVTEGFEKYAWNTGDTTNYLEIKNPVAGTEYAVTVTTATGCTLELKGKLPSNIDSIPIVPSYFTKADTIKTCIGSEIKYRPTGVNIGLVDALELGFRDSLFNIFAEKDTILRFVTKDNLGCNSDTTSLFIDILDLNASVQVKKACRGTNDGEITLDLMGDTSLVTSLNGSTFEKKAVYTGLQTGFYTLTIKNETGCEYSRNVIIVEQELPEIDKLTISPSICELKNASIEVFGDTSNVYSLNGADFTKTTKWTELEGGEYTLRFKNTVGCIQEKKITVDIFLNPTIAFDTLQHTTCGLDNGQIKVSTQTGNPPFSFTLLPNTVSTNGMFSPLKTGNYIIIAKDVLGCTDTIEASLNAIPYVTINGVKTTDDSCPDPNGSATFDLKNGNLPYTLTINKQTKLGPFQDKLAAGNYTAEILSSYGCRDTINFTIKDLANPRIEDIIFYSAPCGTIRAFAEISSFTYNNSSTYAINNGGFSKTNKSELRNGLNKISIKDDLGCVYDTTIFVGFDFPNIFSPNDDASNDEFCTPDISNFNGSHEMQIFDRWGNKVYYQKEFNQKICWDGTMDTKYVTNGVYVYYIEINYSDGRKFCKHGDITVFR